MAFVDFTDEELDEALSNPYMIEKDKANLKKVSFITAWDSLGNVDSTAYSNIINFVDKLQNARDNLTLEVIHDQEQYGDDTFFDIREWRYKNLYYLEVTCIHSEKTYIVLSSSLRDYIYEYFFNGEVFCPQVIETGGGVDKNAVNAIIDERLGTTTSDNLNAISEALANNDTAMSAISNGLNNNVFANHLAPQILTTDFYNTLANNEFLQDKIANNLTIKQMAQEKIDELISNEAMLETLAIKLIDYMHLNGVDFTYAPNIMRVTIVDENGQAVNLALDKENGIYQTAVDLNGRYTIQVSARDEL